MGFARRQMRRRGIMSAAATVSMVSSARRNRAERKALDQSTNAQQNEEMPQAEASSGQDPVEQLKQYKELLDQGIITQEDFDRKKKELLGL